MDDQREPQGHPRKVPPARRRQVRIALLVAVALLLAVAAPTLWRIADFAVRVDEGVVAEPTVTPFYESPTPSASQAPGTVVRSEPIVGAPAGSRAWRIVYHSTDEDGADALVSGVVVVPDGAAPEDGRTIVSWAHPTTGTAPRCAPSSGIAPFWLIEGLTDLLADGYVVVATDYSGMGLAGPPSYLIGDVEAANVLDIARAARTMPEASASDRVILWGHSQGGHAALFAAERARDHAPELDVLGAAVAAPATGLTQLLDAGIVDVSGITIGAYAFDAYADAYSERLPDDPLSAILTDAGAAAVAEISSLCLLGQNSELHELARPLVGGFLRSDPANDPAWQTLLAENSPSARLDVPVFVAQGAQDTLVLPQITASYVAAREADGTRITSHVYPDAGHGDIALTALPDVREWMRTL